MLLRTSRRDRASVLSRCSRLLAGTACIQKAPRTHGGGERAQAAIHEHYSYMLLCSQFIRLLGHEPIEYNQEQCRVKSYDGREALIRSFPSKLPFYHLVSFTGSRFPLYVQVKWGQVYGRTRTRTPHTHVGERSSIQCEQIQLLFHHGAR